MPIDDSDEPPPLPKEFPDEKSADTTELPVASLAEDEPPMLPGGAGVARSTDDEPPELPEIPEPYNRVEWDDAPAAPVEKRTSLQHVTNFLENAFGFATIIVTLAVLSAIPILNFLSLGYLLQVSANVAQRGKISAAFVGVKKAAIAGSLIIGTWLVVWPVRIVSGLWMDAQLVAPGSATESSYGVALFILTILTIVHVTWAWLRGGKLRHFFWPAPIAFIKWIRSPQSFEEIGDKVVGYLESLRFQHYFWLGARGFAGGLCWLIGPVGILILASFLPTGGGVLFSFIGSTALFVVVLYLPFLQAHFALQNRLSAMFELRTVRQLFRRAPLAYWTALFITLLFALPLYLLKVELTAQEIAWLPGLFFVAFIFPARALSGWALGRSIRHDQPRFFLSRWAARLLAFPVVGFYVLFVYLSQFYSWDGVYSLLEQHAFMVPAPLMGL